MYSYMIVDIFNKWDSLVILIVSTKNDCAYIDFTKFKKKIHLNAIHRPSTFKIYILRILKTG